MLKSQNAMGNALLRIFKGLSNIFQEAIMKHFPTWQNIHFWSTLTNNLECFLGILWVNRMSGRNEVWDKIYSAQVHGLNIVAFDFLRKKNKKNKKAFYYNILDVYHMKRHQISCKQRICGFLRMSKTKSSFHKISCFFQKKKKKKKKTGNLRTEIH